jgi:hypothetical protein
MTLGSLARTAAGLLRRARWTLLILAGAGLLTWLLRDTRLEEDPVRSLTHPDPVRAALFDHYQEKGVFKDRVYLEDGGLGPAERAKLDAALAAAGYAEVPLLERPAPEQVLSLAPLLPAAEVARLFSDEALAERAREAAGLAMLPGGDAYLAELDRDPLGLGPALLGVLSTGASGGGAGEAAAPMRAFKSPVPLHYDRVGDVYDLLVSFGPRVHFIGADFFAVENYRAANHDIVLCSLLSLALNLLIFWIFTRRWSLLGLLLLGTVVSGLTGLAAIRAFWPEVFAVVLAYTSTFVGYNNESLVHLSGLGAHGGAEGGGRQRARALLGVWSAIGTTVIGFLVLLLGRSPMVRQMAVSSLGGLCGFLLFLVPYRKLLGSVRFREVRLPTVPVRGRTLALVCAACAAGVAVIGVPHIATEIEGFRFQTPVLDEQIAHFSRRLDAFGLEDVVAVAAPAGGSPADALAPLVKAGAVDPARHPLAQLPSREAQEATLRALAGYGEAVARFEQRLLEAGMRIAPSRSLPPGLAPLDAWTYLDRLGAVGPVRWSDEAGGRRWVMAGLTRAAQGKEWEGAVPVSPRHHYDALLTSFSRELGWLFLAGLAVMAVYLVYLQKRATRVLYVFAPLFLSALAFAVYSRLAGGSIHIVHVMGFSLVIALALDYTAVAVSGEHGPVELSKVLLTGVSTLATFGILLLARHPVLRELGATVTIGCAVSLAFALLVSLRGGEGRS